MKKNKFIPVTFQSCQDNLPSLNILKIFITVVIFLFASCKSDKEKLKEAIVKGEASLFDNSTHQVNDSVAADVLNHYMAYADAYKDDTTSGEYLFKAAELESSRTHFKQAIDIYERLIVNYPNHKKAAAALFMEAFNYETGLGDREAAKTKYKEFLDKYPDHQLAASAKASYDQLNAGLSDEDVVKMFEAKQDSMKKSSN